MRSLLFPAFAATLVITAACGSDSATAPEAAAVTGTYSLKTVNSAPLPYTMPDDGSGIVKILGDSYSLTADGKYTGATQVSITSGGITSVTTLTSSGSYTRSGDSVTLTAADDPTDKVTGTISGANFTISVDGFVLVYQRSGS